MSFRQLVKATCPDSGSLQENKVTVRKGLAAAVGNLRCTQQEALAENAKLAQCC